MNSRVLDYVVIDEITYKVICKYGYKKRNDNYKLVKINKNFSVGEIYRRHKVYDSLKVLLKTYGFDSSSD